MIENLPLITIVTPSYNQGHFIEETILSVLNQDYPNIEYLVIDGGSTDNTLEILAKYEDRLRWISEPDRGQSHAINKGFKIARGEIFAWINSDDRYEPGAVSTSVRYLLDHPDVAMTYGRVNVISTTGELIETTPSPRPYDLWAITYMAYGIDQASTFFRKSALERVGYIDENLNWCMDWDLWIRIGSHFKIGTVDSVIASIRLYYGNKTSTGGLKRIAEIISVIRTASKVSLMFAMIRSSCGMLHMHLKYRHAVLYRYLKGPVLFFKRTVLNRLYSNFQGVYPDGWLGKRARFMVVAGTCPRVLTFALDFPDDSRLLPNSVTILLDKRTAAAIPINGSGIHEVSVQYRGTSLGPVEAVLIFAKSRAPDQYGRRLVCRLLRAPGSSQAES